MVGRRTRTDRRHEQRRAELQELVDRWINNRIEAELEPHADLLSAASAFHAWLGQTLERRAL